jgi:hypothetical protein
MKATTYQVVHLERHMRQMINVNYRGEASVSLKWLGGSCIMAA